MSFIRLPKILLIFFSVLLFLSTAQLSLAATSDVSFSWLRSSEPEVIGYKIYYRKSTEKNYNKLPVHITPSSANVKNGRVYGTVYGLEVSKTYYFAVTSYSRNLESNRSREVKIVTTNPGSSQPSSMAIRPSLIEIEAGEVEVNHSWVRVKFASRFKKPVVVAKVVSYNDSDPVVVRMRNVEPTGFFMKIQEMDSDGRHSRETVSYFVMEAGTYKLYDGSRVEAGTFKASGVGSFKQKKFIRRYAVPPVVMTSIASYNESAPVTFRMKNIAKDGFNYMMQEREADRSMRHAAEIISYIAWQPSNGIVDGLKYSVGKTGRKVNHRFSWNRYNAKSVIFRQPPLVILDMQTTYSSDTAGLRCKNNGRSGLRIMVEEERSKDREIAHAREDVGYIAISQ